MMAGDPAGRSAPEPAPKKKPGYLRRYASVGRAVAEDPSTIKTLLRAAAIKAWSAKGGGLYGLGFVIYFVVLEVRMLVEEIIASSGVVDFIVEQAFQLVLRFAFESLGNVLLAFLWPIKLVGETGWVGIVLLVVGFFSFERWGRAWIEAQVPDLASANRARVADKDARKAAKIAEKAHKREHKQQNKRPNSRKGERAD